MGPPQLKASPTPSGARLRSVPSGFCQRNSPVARSIALSVDHGGATQGVFHGESSAPRITTYGVPSCGFMPT